MARSPSRAPAVLAGALLMFATLAIAPAGTTGDPSPDPPASPSPPPASGEPPVLGPGFGGVSPMTGARAAEYVVEGMPVEPGTHREPDLVELTRLDPTIRLDIRYARSDNFTGTPVYKVARAFLQRPAAEALVRVHRSLEASGYGLLVFDGYRPWSVTKRFWEITPADKKEFVADPAQGSRHNRGAAVDLTLFDLRTGREVEMPSAYDDFTAKAYATYPGGDELARERRDLLRDAMEAEGFFVYPNEWWHYDFKDWREYPVLNVPFDKIDAGPGTPPQTSPPGRAGQPPAFPGRGFGATRPIAGYASSTPLSLGGTRLVDLTWTFDASTLYWPTSPSGFALKQLSHGKTEAGYFYSANSFCAPEHGGTHLDAPIHFAEKGWTADKIPLERLIAPGVVIDIVPQAEKDADYRLTRDDVLAWEKKHGEIAPGTIVLVRTGWGARWPDRIRYFGDATPRDASRLHFPGYGEEAARLLAEKRKVAALGIDTPSIDYGPSRDFAVHVATMQENVLGLENVARLEEVPPTGAIIVALPVKIGGGSGAPLRLVAIVPKAPPAPPPPSASPGAALGGPGATPPASAASSRPWRADQ